MSSCPTPNLKHRPDGWRPWHNHVPDWVQRHPAVSDPKPGKKIAAKTARLVLQVIADAADIDDDGNLIGAIGGSNLAKGADLAKRTVDRYITYLVEHGLVVVMSRGGVLGLGQRAKKQSVSNTYGIPATAGSLDHRRVNRRCQVMKRDGELPDGRPRYVPDVQVPGSQAALWPQPKQPTPQQAGYPTPGSISPGYVGGSSSTPASRGSPISGGGDSTPMTPGQYRNVPGAHYHLPSSSPGEMVKNHGARGVSRNSSRRKRGGRGGKRKHAPKLPHHSVDDLRDIDRLLRLYRASVLRGVVRDEPIDRVRFVATAVSVLRVCQQHRPGEQNDPCKMFAHRVNEERWLYIGCEDEAMAQQMLNDHDRRTLATHPASPATACDPGSKQTDASAATDSDAEAWAAMSESQRRQLIKRVWHRLSDGERRLMSEKRINGGQFLAMIRGLNQ